MPNLFARAEAAVLNPLRRPALSGVAEHGAFWSLAALLILVLLRFLPGPPGALNTLALFVVVPLWLVFSCIILYRWLVNYVLWKVRNRLVVTYLLMGLAPVVLFVTLATIAAYVFAGQFATFAATSELQSTLGRLSAENQAFAVHVAHAIARAPSANSVELGDYEAANHSIPGRLTVDAWVGTATDHRHLLLISDGRELPQHNADDPMAYPTWSHDGFRGVVLDGGHLFLRAVNTRTVADHQVTFVSSAPLDPTTVDELAQGLGLIHIIPDVRALAQDDSKNTHVERGRASPRELAEQTSGTVNGGSLMPGAFLLDRRITFSAPLFTTDWKNGKQLISLISVTSRPALLYAHLFGTAFVVGTVIRYGLIILASIFAVIELIAFIMAVRLNRTITNAVADLYRATTAIDSGNFTHRIRVQRRDQLGALSTSFNTMSESLERLLEQQREKERMQSELEIAQEVQNNLFPHGQVEMPGLELHGICKPARTVSGDYYDFLIMGENELCLATGDISGKGISAALLMASLHSAVRAYRFAGEDCFGDNGGTDRFFQGMVTFSSPGKVLSLLNRHLYRSTQPEKYATLFLAHYNTNTRKLTYSNGGQLPPFVLCANGTVRRLDRGGSVVGLLDDLVYDEGTVTLDPGDILIAYSDGVTEPENEFGEFGEERLIEMVQRHRHLPLAAISQQVLQSLRAWIGDQEQPDDITLVLARQAAAGSN
ncbi:MAG: phosphoserine phosphatase RsbU/P [Acidobacteriaceae bacterium]|jgi:sigma-B regulation protein RsbU (phosphoserine phosphatase)|nr:phosphoserine phosphatase RsbU/P [Acidobacteriaceae bacterium]